LSFRKYFDRVGGNTFKYVFGPFGQAPDNARIEFYNMVRDQKNHQMRFAIDVFCSQCDFCVTSVYITAKVTLHRRISL